jgi:hypothetical protein
MTSNRKNISSLSGVRAMSGQIRTRKCDEFSCKSLQKRSPMAGIQSQKNIVVSEPTSSRSDRASKRDVLRLMHTLGLHPDHRGRKGAWRYHQVSSLRYPGIENVALLQFQRKNTFEFSGICLCADRYDRLTNPTKVKCIISSKTMNKMRQYSDNRL